MYNNMNNTIVFGTTNKKSGWPLFLILMTVLPLLPASQAMAFTWSVNNIEKAALYNFDEDEDLVLSPNSINWNLEFDVVVALFNTIDWATIYDCSDWGAVTSAVIYIKFLDGTITPYEYTPPYISRIGMYGVCREVNDAGNELILEIGQ